MTITTMSGAPVSAYALGAMSFGNAAAPGTSRALYDAARAQGINHFDTAHNGSDDMAEAVLGAFAAGERDQVILATKPDPWRGHGRKQLLASIDESLTRLQSDYIDLFYLTGWTTDAVLSAALEVLGGCLATGKVRSIGLAHVTFGQLVTALSTATKMGVPIAAVQTRYNLLRREAEADLLPLCQNRGISTFSYSPLAGGLLAGRYATGREVHRADERILPNRHAPDDNHRIAAELAVVAREVGVIR
jgi:aryl-alcohol dehydrogenase-like predicted oxidoreductase